MAIQNVIIANRLNIFSHAFIKDFEFESNFIYPKIIGSFNLLVKVYLPPLRESVIGDSTVTSNLETEQVITDGFKLKTNSSFRSFHNILSSKFSVTDNSTTRLEASYKTLFQYILFTSTESIDLKIGRLTIELNSIIEAKGYEGLYQSGVITSSTLNIEDRLRQDNVEFVETILDEPIAFVDYTKYTFSKELVSTIESGSVVEVGNFIGLMDSINVKPDVSSYFITNEDISSLIKLISDVSFVYDHNVSSSIKTKVSLLQSCLQFKNILNRVSYKDSLINNFEYSIFIKDDIDVLFELLYKILIESKIAIKSDVSSLKSSFNIERSKVLFEDSVSDYLSYLFVIGSNIKILTALNSSVILNNVLFSNIIIALESDSSGNYVSYILSTVSDKRFEGRENLSVTNYKNYNFDGSCRFNDNYLFINNKGLYKYGGTLDNTSEIQSEIQTSALSFGTSNLKQIPNLYMGLSNSNKLILKVSVDGKSSIYYTLNKKTENLMTQNISIGKGLIGRYFQFELITLNNTQFKLDSIEFLPIKLKRKI